MTPNYRVEVEKPGCEHCGSGTHYGIVSGAGEDEIMESVTYDDKEHAEEICEDLNSAFDKGRASMNELLRRANLCMKAMTNCFVDGNAHDPCRACATLREVGIL